MNYSDNSIFLYGMASKNYLIDEENKIIYKSKAKNKIIVFDKDFDGDYDEINYSYIVSDKKPKGSYSSTLIVQGPFNEEWFKLTGKKNRDLRNTKNKFNKICSVREYNSETDYEGVLKVIDEWDTIRGINYGWQRHSGYDRNFFTKYYNQIKDRIIALVYIIDDKIIGYSVISKEPVNNEFCYLIRKYSRTDLRNLCVYIDYKLFEWLYNLGYENFTVNLGGSSGGVEHYKTIHFPIFRTDKVYFYKKKKY